MTQTASDQDDAPFADIPATRPCHLTKRGLCMIHVHETWNVLESLQREIDEFIAKRDSQ